MNYIRVARVTNTVGATDKGLEGDVGDELTEGALYRKYQ